MSESFNLNRRNTDTGGPSPAKKGKHQFSNVDTAEKFDILEPEVVSPSKSFMPLALVSEWEEALTTTPMISVAIILPSGVGVGDFMLRVIEDGDVLELTVKWPAPMVDIELMHVKWLKNGEDGKPISTDITRHHPKILGFQKKLRMVRQHFENTPESIARFGLPFTVQSHINAQYNLGWASNATRMVYVDLRSVNNNYAAVKNSTEFEIH